MSTATRTSTHSVPPVMYAGQLIKEATDVLEDAALHPSHQETVCLGSSKETVDIGHPAKIDIVTTPVTVANEELIRLLAHHAGVATDEIEGHLAAGGDTKVASALNGSQARAIVRCARENATEVELRLHDDSIELGAVMNDEDPTVHVIASSRWTVSVDSIAIVRELSGRRNSGKEFLSRSRTTSGGLFDVVRNIPAGWGAAISDELKIKGFDCVSVRRA